MIPQLLMLAFVAQHQPGETLDAETIRLARVRYHMTQNLTRLPNYTCLQTIERSRRRARSRKFQLDDTLRMEVALVGGRELFSWPGEGKFEERELREMVQGGTFGNGNFGMHARSVFMSSSPVFKYEGEEQVDGRKVFRYSYHVPQNLSGYKVRVGEKEAIVAYSGHFLIDERTLDAVELTVATEDIPPFLEISTSITTMRYERMRIGEEDFLLPRSSVLAMEDLYGNESRNVTEFTGCRQYATESFISFADPPPEAESYTPPVIAQEVSLPEGLTLDLRLETTIDRNSAIGDQIIATVGANAKHKGQVLVPKGARVSGRILEMEHTQGRVEGLLVVLDFSEITFPGSHSQAELELEGVSPSILPGTRVDVMKPRDTTRNAGTISLRGNRLQLGRGFRMLWRVSESK